MLLLGDQIKPINPVMSYYIKYYAIKKVLNFVNSNFRIPNFTAINLQITHIRLEIDQLRKQNNERFKDFDKDMSMIEDSALRLFNHIDDLERNGDIALCSQFIFCSHLMGLMFFYQPKRVDFEEKMKYSQYKALDQYNKMEKSGVYINNMKINIGQFVDSYLFDVPTTPAIYSQAQSEDIRPPIIGQLKVVETEAIKERKKNEEQVKIKVQLAISEIDFKNLKKAKEEIQIAISLLNQLLQ